MDIKAKIENSLDKIRPGLELDGGNVKLVDFDEKTGIARVEMQGACAGCPMAQMTLKGAVEAQLKADIAGIKEVKSVN